MAGEPDELDPRGLSFRGLRSSDLGPMHRWLNAPHVGRWWYDEGTSHQEIEEKYLPRIEGRDAAKPFVILYEDGPIGYVQSYPIPDDEEYASPVDAEDSAGVDLFIGEAEYLYRGPGQYVVPGFLSEHVFCGSLITPLIILPAVPLTTAGAFGALPITGTVLSLPALLVVPVGYSLVGGGFRRKKG